MIDPIVVTLRTGATHLAVPSVVAPGMVYLSCAFHRSYRREDVIVSPVLRSIGCAECKVIRRRYIDSLRQLALGFDT